MLTSILCLTLFLTGNINKGMYYIKGIEHFLS